MKIKFYFVLGLIIGGLLCSSLNGLGVGPIVHPFDDELDHDFCKKEAETVSEFSDCLKNRIKERKRVPNAKKNHYN